MTTLFLDTETFSTVPIKQGTHRYAEYSDILLVAWAFNEEDVTVEEFDPARTQFMIDSADVVVAQNSFFDRTVLAYNGVTLPINKIEDTMAIALAHSLSGGLDEMCTVLKVPVDLAKQKDGKKLINLFTKPRPKNTKLRRATKETHPEAWARFVEYARFDVISMRECYKRLPRWNMTVGEHKLWQLDQKINDRGICIDMDLAHAALRAAADAQKLLSARASDMTGGRIKSARQRGALLTHLSGEFEFSPDDMKKGTLTALLKNPNISGEMREIIEIRLQAAATSPAKYTTLVKGASSRDNRLRGILQFCGASRTGRWGGRMFQPQNLPRPTIRQKMIELGIDAMKRGVEDLLFENVMELLASAVRGSLIAPRGKKLVISDLSNIEGRMLAWLAGEEWKVKAFKEFDEGVGHDLYVLAYARAFGVSPETVIHDKEHAQGLMRLIGKVMELALGYGGAVGAFTTMGVQYGLEPMLEEIVADIVRKWRRAHPKIVTFWYDVEWACRQALRNPGEKFVVGPNGSIVMDRVTHNDMTWLRIRLPSGRYLSYPNADERDDGKLVYDGNNQYTKKWEQLDTYGPKIVENIVQAAARDVLARGMRKAEDKGYEVCLHVHDELVTEVDDVEDYTDDELSALMAETLPWTLGLPLAAKGFSCHRYRKD